jgi:hypothetical protein
MPLRIAVIPQFLFSLHPLLVETVSTAPQTTHSILVKRRLLASITQANSTSLFVRLWDNLHFCTTFGLLSISSCSGFRDDLCFRDEKLLLAAPSMIPLHDPIS